MLTIAFAIVLFVPAADACTVMRLEIDGQTVIARNHDWFFGEGMAVVSRRGIQRTGMVPVRPASWTTKYGSVGFVQFGFNLPFAGMNEKGLTVDLLQLHEAVMPSPSSHQADCVNVIQWVQYQLDMSASVEEVIASLNAIQPVPILADAEKVHFFITDETGDVAVVEFLEGKAVVHHSVEVMNCALANTVWSESRDLALKSPRNRRYERATSMVKANREENDQTAKPIDVAFSSLRRVAQSELTQWALAYQPSKRVLTWTTRSCNNRRHFDLKTIDFSPSEESPVRMLDLNAEIEGDAKTHLVDFDISVHRKMVDEAFEKFGIGGIPRTLIVKLIDDQAIELTRKPEVVANR